MRSIIEHIKQLDWVLIGALAVLFMFGLLTLYAAPEGSDIFNKQAVFGVVALLLIVTVAGVNYRLFRDHSILLLALYGAGIALLVGLFLFGSRIRGVTGWFVIGGLAIQPVEIVKVLVVLVLAVYLSRRHIELYRLRHLFISALYAALPAVLVLAQPDLGSAFILAALWVGMVILSGIKGRQFALIVLLGVILAGLLWGFALQDYQKDRVLSFLNPEADPLGGGYQTRQAVIALGSGGLFGKGLGEGSQARLGFLPEYQSDFIFAAIGEEWGFVGVLVILALFGVVLWRLVAIWHRADNNFARLLVGGVFLLIAVHVVINIGTNVGIFPVTGLPLPFVSAGGSNLLSLAIAIGLAQSVYKYSTMPRSPHRDRGFEYLEGDNTPEALLGM